MTWSAELYRIAAFDFDRAPLLSQDHTQFFTPESWARLRRCVSAARRKEGKHELDLVGVNAHGTKLRLIVRVERIADANGVVLFRGTVQDVTSRKLTDEALLSATGRLITAQEDEKFRIARELHDDLGQRMTLLHVGMDELKTNIAQLSRPAEQLDRLVEIAGEVSRDIHDLSHQLHPSRLEMLGLVGSLEGLCREFSAQHKLRVRFHHEGTPAQCPKEMTLCLYRIAREALQNVAKHSDATDADVELSNDAAEIRLGISDSGRGFHPDSVSSAAGLGFVNMRERLRLVGGELSIQSEPSRGTRIQVLVPKIAGPFGGRAE